MELISIKYRKLPNLPSTRHDIELNALRLSLKSRQGRANLRRRDTTKELSRSDDGVISNLYK